MWVRGDPLSVGQRRRGGDAHAEERRKDFLQPSSLLTHGGDKA